MRVAVCPSTWLQSPLEIGMTEINLEPEPAAFMVHATTEAGVSRTCSRSSAVPDVADRRRPAAIVAAQRNRGGCTVLEMVMTRRTPIRPPGAALVATLLGVAVLAGSASAGAASPAERAAPVNTAPPAISGQARVGTTLSATQGEWQGSPNAFFYQWLRCNAGERRLRADRRRDRPDLRARPVRSSDFASESRSSRKTPTARRLPSAAPPPGS